MKEYQKKFIDFLISSEALLFGEFTTKSGRHTPYFINTGKFFSGQRIAQLGEFYATHLKENNLLGVDTIFGPAYKGVPLCVATASAAFKLFGQDLGYTFNRKETKQHGDQGKYVGYPLDAGCSIAIVEDVITAGTTLKEIVPILRAINDLKIAGVVIAVDRCERGEGTLSAVGEIEQSLKIKVSPLVTTYQILEYLKEPNGSKITLDDEMAGGIERYLDQFGAKDL